MAQADYDLTQAWYTTREVSEMLGVTVKAVRDWVRRGELAAMDLGGPVGYKISENALKQFMERRQVRPLDLTSVGEED